MAETVEVVRVPVTVTCRYLLRRPDGADPAPLLIGCHGYGENAAGHLKELDSIPGAASWVCCAVEAPHAFYNRRSDEVVGSWMTRRDREEAIASNRAYLSEVVRRVKSECRCGPTLVLAGFSQGTSMAYRAAAATGSDVAGLIVLCGDLPPELTPAEIRRFGTVLIGQGRSDEWYDDAKRAADAERLQTAGVAVETVVFDGGHEWTDAFREAAGRFLDRVRAAGS